MSESISETTGKYHDPLASVLASLKGTKITQAEAREALVHSYPKLHEVIGWIMLSDHCFNHVVKGSCRCAGTTDALVERLGRNRYLVR